MPDLAVWGGGLPVSGRRLLVIHNPVAGARRRRRFRAVLEALEAGGVRVTVRDTTGRGDAERIARDVATTGDAAAMDAVVAAGGDGTINEVVNGLLARPAVGGNEGSGRGVPPLGVLPLGTANVLAWELGLPGDPAGLAAVLGSAPARRAHLGLANGRAFVMMAGVGLDARVVEQVDPVLKRLAGKGAYAVETMRQILFHRPPCYRVAVGGREWPVGAVIVAKGRLYGGRFVCAPRASLAEPGLQVCLFSRIGRRHALRYTAGVVLGTIGGMRDYAVVPAERVTVTGPEGDAVQGDGDVIARLPLTVSVAPHPLPVLAP